MWHNHGPFSCRTGITQARILLLLIIITGLVSHVVSDEKNDTFDAIAYYNKGVDLAHEGNYTGALQMIDQALTITPNFTLAHVTRAGIYTETGNYQEAIRAVNTALELDPGNPSLLTVIANLYLLAGDNEAVLQITDEAIRNDPMILETWIIRGSAFGSLKRYKEEEEASQMALSLSPDSVDAQINLKHARDHLYSSQIPEDTPKSGIWLFCPLIAIGFGLAFMCRREI
ncbi:MAG: tetratricopeptide repeat protein [Methanospirillaceae archaeon]|nr:tetratricopeptide repeat protein [Methanospirillaceae archaeon]